jgi:DNA-binding transcriptional LysR family regulator
VELSKIVGLPLALPDFDFGVRQIVARASAAAGLRITPVLLSNVFETLRDFVRGGAGVAILPMRATRHWEGSEALKAIPLVGAPFINATIDIVVRRTPHLPRIVEAFVDCLIRTIASMPESTHS